MSTKLPALHDGHAPITLQQAFHDALEAVEGFPDDKSGQIISVEGHNFAITDVIAAMSGCTDLVPIRTQDVLTTLARRIDAPFPGSLKTFGDWAGLVQRYCREHVFVEPYRACA